MSHFPSDFFRESVFRGHELRDVRRKYLAMFVLVVAVSGAAIHLGVAWMFVGFARNSPPGTPAEMPAFKPPETWRAPALELSEAPPPVVRGNDPRVPPTRQQGGKP